jgi:plastocyanin
MNKYLVALIILVAFVSVVATGYLLFKNTVMKILSQNVSTQTTQKVNLAEINKKVIPAETITLTNSGFVPQTITIKAGARVVWLNKSGVVGTVNSDNYPTNLLYPFLNFGQFDNGSSFSTVFPKTGIYTYYNFLSQNQSQRGKVIVK